MTTKILKSYSLDAGHRIVGAVNEYRNRFGVWPTTIHVWKETADALREHTFTPPGWAMLTDKLKVVPIDEGTIIAEGPEGRFEYDGGQQPCRDGSRADVWIWGKKLAD